jgi:hypothetical protein
VDGVVRKWDMGDGGWRIGDRSGVGCMNVYMGLCVGCCLGGNHASGWSAVACMHACHATVISHTSLPVL